MVTTVRSLGLQGISGYEVTVECFLSGGLPAFDVVGLGDTAVKEARERVRAAIKNCGAKFPVSRITVNLAPANLKKEGTVYDLPLLLGILAGEGEIDAPDPAVRVHRRAVAHRRAAPHQRCAADGDGCGACGREDPLCPRGERRRGDAGRRSDRLRRGDRAAASAPPARRGAALPRAALGADGRGGQRSRFCRRHGAGERQARAGDRRRRLPQRASHRLARCGQVHARAASAAPSFPT